MVSCNGNFNPSRFVVVNVENIIFGNETLKKFTCKNLSFGFPETYTYIEKIGSERVLVEDLADCAWIAIFFPSFLRCFEENGNIIKTEFYKKFGDLPCDYKMPVSTEGIFQDMLYYPNPVSQVLHSSLFNSNKKIFIYSATGSLVKTISPHTLSDEINLQFLQNGAYFIHLLDQNNKWQRFKIIKQ